MIQKRQAPNSVGSTLARAARCNTAFSRITTERRANVGSATQRLIQIPDEVGAAELEPSARSSIGAVRRVAFPFFSTASDMLADLAAQESSATLGRRLLFEVVRRRYDA